VCICTAVNIDGSTYYLAVAPIIPNVGDLVHFYGNNESYLATVIEMVNNSCRDVVLDRMPIGRENNTLDYREIKKVIATDNPAPIAPTVVDMAKLLADKEEVIVYSSADALDPCGYSGTDFNIGFQIGYNTCKKTHGFTDEDMLSFAVFASVHGDDKSLEELFDIWKERQYEVVHYVDNNNMIEVAERLYRGPLGKDNTQALTSHSIVQ
jgi:hypothetical protein